MIPIIRFISRNAFISSSVVSKLPPFCVAYIFVSVTMISRSSLIHVTVWNMSKDVELWPRSMSTSASLVHSFLVIGFSLSSHFHSLTVFVFFFFVLSSSCGTLPFFWFVLFSYDEALTFFFFVLSLIIRLCFCFLVFWGIVVNDGGVDLNDWSKVRWVAAAGDLLAVYWLEVR